MKQITKAQLEDIVEHISDNIGGYIYNSAAQNIAPTEATTTTSQEYKVGEQFYYNKILYTATVPIANGGTIVISGENKNCEPSPTLTKQLADLGTASTKDAISVVTDSSDLVESGAVKDIVGWGNKNGFDLSNISTGESYFTSSQKGKVINIANPTAGTYKNTAFLVSVKPNTDMHIVSNVSVSSGVARISVSTADNVTEIASSGAITSETVDLSFNTGNNTVLLIKVYCTTSTSELGNVTYTDMMLLSESETDLTYEPYHASVEETLRDAEVIEGKNLLENLAISQTFNGITFTVNSDGSVTANGTTPSDKDATIILNQNFKITQGDILTGCPSGGGSQKYFLAIEQNISPYTHYARDEGSGDVINETVSVNTVVYITIIRGNTVNNLIFKPMLRKATETDATYESSYTPLKDVVPQKVNNSVIAPVESGTTASTTINETDHFMHNGEFCTATSSISANAALTKNSNYKTEVIGDILNDLYTSIGYLSSPVSSMVANHAPCLKRDITTAFYSGTLRAEIAEGNFKNVRPGDYIIGQATGSTYYVAHLDYMYNLGDQTGSAYQSQAYGKHHLGLMLYKPVGTTSLWLGKGEAGGSWQVSANDKGRCPWNAATDVDPTSTAALGSNNTNITRTYNGASVSGYMGSFIRERIDAILLPQCFQADFGSANVLKFRNLNGNAITTDKPAGGQSNWNGLTTGWAWYDRYTDLASEVELYGTRVFCSAYDIGVQNRQLAIYRNADINDFYPRMDIWTKGVASSTYACTRYNYGFASFYDASVARWACPLACVA